MRKSIYILVTDNGEEYSEDRISVNSGVFLSLESAIEFLKTSGEIAQGCSDATIEVWDIRTNKKTKHHYAELKYKGEGDMQWELQY